MRQKLEMTISVIALVVAALIPWSLAAGQGAAPPSLQEQLQAQYKSVKMGSDSNGPTVLEEGTVLEHRGTVDRKSTRLNSSH